MKKLATLFGVALLLISGSAYAQKAKSTIIGEIAQSSAATLLGGAILNDMVNSYIDYLTCSSQGGMVFYNALSKPDCLAPGVNGQTLNMVGGFPAWTNNGSNYTRVTVNFPVQSSTALTNVSGLTATLTSGNTYAFAAKLYYTDAAAGGVQASICGTTTASNIVYNGWAVDSGSNGIKGSTQAAALCTPVASTTTTGTSGEIKIEGTLTASTNGTLTVQFAQNTSNATSSIVLQGSTFVVDNIH